MSCWHRYITLSNMIRYPKTTRNMFTISKYRKCVLNLGLQPMLGVSSTQSCNLPLNGMSGGSPLSTQKDDPRYPLMFICIFLEVLSI